MVMCCVFSFRKWICRKRHSRRFITIRQSSTYLDRIAVLICYSYGIGPQRSGSTRYKDNQGEEEADGSHDLSEECNNCCDETIVVFVIRRTR